MQVGDFHFIKDVVNRMYKITFADSEQTFYCGKDENLLSAARKNAMNIMRGCCSGGCGVCKIKIEEGQFLRETSSMAVLPQKERNENFSLACKTIALSDLRISLVK